MSYGLGGKMINYFDGYIIDDDILNYKEHIVMQQDKHSTVNSDKYRLILGNCIIFILLL